MGKSMLARKRDEFTNDKEDYLENGMGECVGETRIWINRWTGEET